MTNFDILIFSLYKYLVWDSFETWIYMAFNISTSPIWKEKYFLNKGGNAL